MKLLDLVAQTTAVSNSCNLPKSKMATVVGLGEGGGVVNLNNKR